MNVFSPGIKQTYEKILTQRPKVLQKETRRIEKKTHQVKGEVIDSKLDGGMLNLSIKNDNNKSIVPNFWAGYKSSTNYQKQKTKMQ